MIKEKCIDDLTIDNKSEGQVPRSAIILAAGFGLRMIPINIDRPKALLSINGERVIERLIRQLREAGVESITVVVGYMKDELTYLKEKYDITLVENADYCDSNNLYSLFLVSEKISNTFILPSDIWCRTNPFLSNETDSYYMIYEDGESHKKEYWDAMTGIAYIDHKDGIKLRQLLHAIAESELAKTAFWEEALYDSQSLWIRPKIVPLDSIRQINTFEDLRELDSHSEHLQSEAIDIICQTLQVETKDINGITALKKGMTNRSFLFSCGNKKYIMRIPGEGTDLLINRQQEFSVYRTLDGANICDEIIYINPEKGYKITKFIENARSCDLNNRLDLEKCMSKLREFHTLELQVNHDFDIFEQIEFYETLLDGAKSIYSDYEQIKKRVFSLTAYIDKHTDRKVLTHIDAVPDNFLIYSEDGVEEIRLIDWEYAGMQDPHVDIAMFCIYSLYNKEQIDELIDIYFRCCCPTEIRIKIYCYIAACGLLWSNWCEYKRSLGVDFGEYAASQYKYAKEFSLVLENNSIVEEV
ncbi:NTP transferase domain-containing protein [Streptococcus suis]|uniref:NTP transferase domain-containing protein n=1 Tax=Streptococcus suis TaxID=1307 RepID=UPI00041393F6|nr:NTP transferase domain-containing protein [Streptococcus suis]